MAKKKETAEQRWTDIASKRLKGHTITDCRYLTTEERDMLGWDKRCIVLVLDNGTLIYPGMDDEANDGGALLGNDTEGEFTIPVLGQYADLA